jgi:hypothetical protein
MNILINVVLLVNKKLEFRAKLLTKFPDLFLFPLLFDTFFVGHPYAGNIDLAVLLVTCQDAANSVMKSAYTDLKITANLLQVLLQFPHALSQKLGPELAASPEATDWSSRFRVG